MMSTKNNTIQDYCRHILESGDLNEKLSPPSLAKGLSLQNDPNARPLFIDQPMRNPEIQMRSASEKLPKLHEINRDSARMTCLQRFAHHELMAVELFAWAILAYPQMPDALKRGFLQTLMEEQAHCRLYIDRITSLGGRFGEAFDPKDPPGDGLWWT